MVLALALMVFVGCSNAKTEVKSDEAETKVSETENKDSDEKESEVSESQKPELVLKYGELNPETHPMAKGAEEFARLIEEKTDGRIKIETYLAGQLGDEKTMMQSLQMGAVDMFRGNVVSMGDFGAEIMNLFTDIVTKNYEMFAQSEYDCVGVQGNIANGSMMGADFFDDHVLPFERKALEVLISANKPTIYHNCGNAEFLYSSYKKLGITVWETIAQPPQGDNDLVRAKEYFGDSLVLCGTLDQVDFLKKATPKEIIKAAAQMVEIGKPGGHYIFSTSDYLEVDTPIENVKAMIKGAKSAAKY